MPHSKRPYKKKIFIEEKEIKMKIFIVFDEVPNSWLEQKRGKGWIKKFQLFKTPNRFINRKFLEFFISDFIFRINKLS